MARLDFDSDIDRGEAFQRIGNRNRVGRKHNHQPRGRARERPKKGIEIAAARMKKKADRYHAAVSAYWRGELNEHPSPPSDIGR